VVEEGESSQPAYSPKGDRLLFVSAKRVGHTQPQVYEKNLISGFEQRITFQNGILASPRYHPKENWILYASSTDEIKESPELLGSGTGSGAGAATATNKSNGKIPEDYTTPLELYAHTLGDLHITRLSHHPGFDGEPQFSPDGTRVTWTQTQQDSTKIIELHRSEGAQRTFTKLEGKPTQFVVAPNGKWAAWVEWNADFSEARLRLRKGQAKPEFLPNDLPQAKFDLYFSPDSKWLLWAQKNADSRAFEIWGAELETSCMQRFLFNDSVGRRHPVLSPDLKWLTYTLLDSSRSRILQIPFTPRPGPCPPLDKPVN